MEKIEVGGRGRIILNRIRRRLTQLENQGIWPNVIEMNRATHDRILKYLKQIDRHYRSRDRVNGLFGRKLVITDDVNDETVILR